MTAFAFFFGRGLEVWQQESWNYKTSPNRCLFGIFHQSAWKKPHPHRAHRM
jgi:hypothetical protein